MGLKEFFKNWSEKKKEEREEFKRLERELKFKKILEEKQKSPLQKELEFYEREKQKERLKKLVELERKRRENKLKNLSDPFNKRYNPFREKNDLIKINARWI